MFTHGTPVNSPLEFFAYSSGPGFSNRIIVRWCQISKLVKSIPVHLFHWTLHLFSKGCMTLCGETTLCRELITVTKVGKPALSEREVRWRFQGGCFPNSFIVWSLRHRGASHRPDLSITTLQKHHHYHFN